MVESARERVVIECTVGDFYRERVDINGGEEPPEIDPEELKRHQALDNGDNDSDPRADAEVIPHLGVEYMRPEEKRARG